VLWNIMKTWGINWECDGNTLGTRENDLPRPTPPQKETSCVCPIHVW